MVQRINKIDRGPILGADVSFVISTGDNADMHQFNELNNFVNLYDGGFVQNDSSKQNRYVGVSDNWTPKHDRLGTALLMRTLLTTRCITDSI